MTEFYAIQCYSCEQYQVSQIKKQNKFVCRLCGKKQSIRFVRGKSQKASQVRQLVQQLNLARGNAQQQYEEQNLTDQQNQYCDLDIQHDQNQQTQQLVSSTSSRWKLYQLDSSNNSNQNTPSQEDHYQHQNEDEFAITTTIPDSMYKLHGRKKQKQKLSKTSSIHKQRRQHVKVSSNEFAKASESMNCEEHPNISSQKQLYQSPSTNPTPVNRSKWSSLDNKNNTEDHIQPINDLYGGDTFTTMGTDEVVEEEVQF